MSTVWKRGPNTTPTGTTVLQQEGGARAKAPKVEQERQRIMQSTSYLGRQQGVIQMNQVEKGYFMQKIQQINFGLVNELNCLVKIKG